MAAISLSYRSTLTTNDLCSIQILRALAAWGVVFHHYVQGFHDFSSDIAIWKFFTIADKFGVDVFFVISGFIMAWTLAHRRYEPDDFLYRRLLRIVPAYWVMTLVFIATLSLTPSKLTSFFDWDISTLALSLIFVPHENASTSLTTFPVLTVGWTLNYEIFFYIWLSTLLWISPRHWLLTCTTSLLLLPYIWPNWLRYEVAGSALLHEFAFGLIIGTFYANLKKRGDWPTVLPGIALLISGLFLYSSVYNGEPLLDFRQTPVFWRIGDPTKHISAALLVASALAFEPFLHQIPLRNALVSLGNMSYSTYLAHPIALCISYHSLGQPNSQAGDLLAVGLYTGLTFIFSILSYRLLETGPGTTYLKKILIRKKNPAMQVNV